MSVAASERFTDTAPSRRADNGGLSRLLHPRAIAVIGASPDASKLAGRPMAYLRKFGFAGSSATEP